MIIFTPCRTRGAPLVVLARTFSFSFSSIAHVALAVEPYRPAHGRIAAGMGYTGTVQSNR
jgi:hypothetical protein